MKKQSSRLGETSKTEYGEVIKIIKYDSYKDVYVSINNNSELIHCSYKEFKKGAVKNLYRKSVYGVGFFGVGEHRSRENKMKTKKYQTWHNMLMRCYSEEWQEKRTTYKGCMVCEMWYNFQRFGDWYDKNYYEVDDIQMHLDKDILVKGNKVYSPDTCIFAPHMINTLMLKNPNLRGEFPIGVFFSPDTTGKYRTVCNNQITNKNVNIGYYQTPELAFNAYKEYKENHIKEVADYYKHQIPRKLYDAMYKWKIEITD